MSSQPSAGSRAADPGLPTPAGIYDYFLGGTHFSEADRQAAQQVMALAPEVRGEAIENRAFLQRAVRYVAGHGVTQYVDIGSGFPTSGPVHEVAGESIAAPHVLYVDYDPAVAELGRQLVHSPTVASAVHDLRRPWDIIDDPDAVRLIDWNKPVAVLMVGILHFISDDENPAEIIATFREHMVRGSFLVISHGSAGETPEVSDEAAQGWDRAKSMLTLRTPREIEDLFVGFELVPPGLVTSTEWGTDRPAPTGQGVGLAAVARVP
jgi:S-adenosyl methyltransferase